MYFALFGSTLSQGMCSWLYEVWASSYRGSPPN